MATVEENQFEQGLGNVSWWGYSPAARVWPDDKPIDGGDEKVLLFGAGDGRHILHFLASGEAPQRRMCFYVGEQNLMAYARQMLFLA